MTYTYVTMEVTQPTYDEVAKHLRDAKYDHVFDGEVINMHGLALVPAKHEPAEPRFYSFTEMSVSLADMLNRIPDGAAVAHVEEVCWQNPENYKQNKYGFRVTVDRRPPCTQVQI